MENVSATLTEQIGVWKQVDYSTLKKSFFFVLLQAALLHDTVEDTDTTIEEIAQTFGDRVAGEQ